MSTNRIHGSSSVTSIQSSESHGGIEPKVVRDTLKKELGTIDGAGLWSTSALKAAADGNNPQPGFIYVVVATNPGNKTLTPALADALIDATNDGFAKNDVKARAVLVKDVDLDKLPREAAVLIVGDNEASRAWVDKKLASVKTPSGKTLADGLRNVAESTRADVGNFGYGKNPNNSASVYPWESRAIGGFASISVENVMGTLGLLHSEFKKPYAQWSPSQKELFSLLVSSTINHEVGHTAGNDHGVIAYDIKSSHGASEKVIVPERYSYRRMKQEHPDANVSLDRSDNTGIMEDGSYTADVLSSLIQYKPAAELDANCREAIALLRGRFYEEQDYTGKDLQNPDYTKRMNELYPAPVNQREIKARALVVMVIENLDVAGEKVVAGPGLEKALTDLQQLTTVDAQRTAVRDLMQLASSLREQFGADELASRLETFAKTAFHFPAPVDPKWLGLTSDKPELPTHNAFYPTSGMGVGLRKPRN